MARPDMSMFELPDQPSVTRKNWLVGGGEMGRLIRLMDWTKTPLGAIESWPHSLRTTVNLCLASNFPINIVWGPGHVQIYNDGYRVVVGDKHPAAMGMDYAKCWASAWPAIGGPFERAWEGEASFLENQRMFLQRNGYLEETFFTFSLSPIRDETGAVVGLFHPVTETTSNMLSERRTRALRDLAAQTSEARTTGQALFLAAKTVAAYAFDLPLVLLYALDERGDQARLSGSAGIEPGTSASPALIELGDGNARWPLAQILGAAAMVELNDAQERFHSLSSGPYPEPPNIVLARPILPAGAERAAGIILLGVSPRLPLDEGYRSFCEQLAAGVTTAVTNARAYEEERKRAQALAEIDRAKTEFFSNVSHEFRTPLTLMLGPLEDELGERSNPLPPARRQRLETAHRSSLRLLKLVNTLLDFSRIEAGRAQASYESTDLSAYTLELASTFRSAVEKAGLTLTQDCPPLPEPVYVDREMWEKIVLNLLSNAFKHTFSGSIRVALRWRGDHVELEVADTGVGIPKKAQGRLFERFHRVKGAKSRTHEGTGIGLALVRELVGLHGGEVRVDSEEGRGSVFVVSIKTGTAHLPQDRIGAEHTLISTSVGASAYTEEATQWLPNATAPPTPVHAPGENARPGHPAPSPANEPRPRIIWVDDNADMREYVRRLLVDRYEVRAVNDGLAALAAAQDHPPDLILSDVMMPGLDGFGLLRALRENAVTRTIPVILLSARAGEEASLEGLDAGADDYLAKPFSARELLGRVRTHLELARLRRTWANELEQANRELESFSYSVSHDLRAPLRAVNGFSQMLLAGHGEKLDEEARDYLSHIMAGTRRMTALIDDLLALSKVGRAPLLRESVDLTALAREIVDDLRQREPGRKVAVEIAGSLSAHGDPNLLRIVLVNLLGNAWKYTGKRPEARIVFERVDAADDQAVFCVRDNGAGFNMGLAGQLFVPFKRLHGESEFTGTGIGLATVQRIIARHGGRIWAEAIEDQGATFSFTLEGQR